MIKSVAEFLQGLMARERAVLDAVEITHKPTIGDMYEGLSKELLSRAIPADIGLQVVSGFVSDGQGNLSGQIDCMLVRGEGQEIPYAGAYVWIVKNVIAVFEVKKTLYGGQLKEAFVHINEVRDIDSSYNQSLEAQPGAIDIDTAIRAFSVMTRSVPPPYDRLAGLPWHREILFHTLISEHLSPLRIILGYHGFQTEHGFRKALYDYFEANTGKQGFGVGSLPQLIVSGEYSLVKANGQPYTAPLTEDGWWPFYFSTSVNPVLMLLEIVWTRLNRLFHLGNLWGDDLELEVPHAFLLAKGGRYEDGRAGWNYMWVNNRPSNLEELGSVEDWSPEELTAPQFLVVNELCRGDTIRFEDEKLQRYLAKNDVTDISNFWDDLLRTGLVARSSDGQELILISTNCQTAILPDGRYVAAENNTGRLFRWIKMKFPARLDTDPDT